MGIRSFTRARDRLIAVGDTDASPDEVCAAMIAAFHAVARFDWSALMTVDPSTLLPSGGIVEGFTPDDCAPFWDNELVDADFIKFADLARRADPVATLVDAVDGDLARSPRYRKLYRAIGVADEVRIAFVAGASCIAVGDLVRAAADGPFTSEELTDVRALVPVATRVLRESLGRVQVHTSAQAPVVIVLDAAGNVTAMSAGAQPILDDLRVNDVDGDFPGVVLAAATKARWGPSPSNLTTRLRGRSGRWLRLHVSPVEGDAGAVMLTVEHARPDDLMSILLDSYGLTARETEIVLRLCRGLTSKEIAAELMISAHTVRDHTKAIYEKAGVNSRGGLVAGLFSDHVLDRFHGSVQHLALTD